MNGPIDAELLGRLLDEHGAALALYASQWTDAADDCVQEALIELARQPQVPENVLAWLYRVVKNRALNSMRGDRRRRDREMKIMGERLSVTQPNSMDTHDDLSAAIAALNAIDSAEREIVVMRIWGGLRFEQIADALSVSTATAHRYYEKALETIRQRLETPCSTTTNRPDLK